MKGPFRFGNTGDEQKMILDADGKYVANIQIHQTPRSMGTYDEQRRLACANLLLAAPDLLEAMKAIFDGNFFYHKGGDEKVYQMARAALAKAEGN